MNNNLKDILGNSNKDIDNQRLMDYLTNQLSKTESHEVEKHMANDDFLDDAVEGLQKIGNKKNMQELVEQLNRDLQKQTAKKTERKEKRRLKDNPYTFLIVILILLLLVVSFIVVKNNVDSKKISPDVPGQHTRSSSQVSVLIENRMVL